MLKRGRPATAREAEPLPGAIRPPLLAEGASPVPLGHLSYSALASFERCGYRFYMERVLGIRESEPAFASVPPGEREEAEPGEGAPATSCPSPRRFSPATSRRLALGNTVHAALEWSARNEWRDPGRERVEGLLAREGGRGRGGDRALALIDGWIGSGIRGELGTRHPRPEAPFTLRAAGTVLRGSIDLLAEGDQDEAPLVVDYKTDLRGGRA